MRADRVDLGGERALQQMCAIPARDQCQTMAREHRAERGGTAREFVTELDPGKTGLPGLPEARLEGGVAAEFG